MSELARRNRRKLIDHFGATDRLIIATTPEHVFYCSGYRSMSYDTDPATQMSIVHDNRRRILVSKTIKIRNAHI